MPKPRHADQPFQYPFFVYGTLLPEQPNFALWRDSIREMREATFAGGRLYDMGHYPMLVEADAGWVSGLAVTVRVADYRRILRRLDRLERYRPGHPEESIYRRVLRSINVRADGTETAWVYMGRQDQVAGKAPVASGNWRSYSARRYPDLHDWWAGRRQA